MAGAGALALLPSRPGSAEPTIPTTQPADYVIFTDDGVNVKGQNCKTGTVEETGTDWVTICNSLLTKPNGHTILVDPKVPTSSGTITISKSRVSIVSDSNPYPWAPRPMCGRIHLNTAGGWLDGLKLQGLAMRELDLAIGTNGIEYSTFYDLQILPNGTGVGQRGVIFSGGGGTSGYWQHLTFYNLNITAEADNVAGVTFAQSSFGNGHLAIFYIRMTLNSGVRGCSLIRYTSTGSSAPDVWIYAATYATFDQDPLSPGNHVIEDLSTVQDGGPRGMKIFGLFYEPHGNGDVVKIAASGLPKYFHVDIFGIKCVLASGYQNRWIVNENGNWVGWPNEATNHLLVEGGSIDPGGQQGLRITLGSANQNEKFRVLIRDIVGFNSQGVTTVTPGVSPWTYRNDDCVDEMVYVNAGTVSDISKNGTSIFNSTGRSIYLKPRESVTITYSLIPSVKVDRK